MKKIFMLKEKDIRSELDVNYNREFLYVKDIHDFQQLEHHFQEVDCVACGEKKHYIFSKKDSFYFRKCSECQTVFISPRPRPQELKYWYTHSEHVKNSQIILEKTANVRAVIYNDRIEKIFSRISCPVKSVLEIGCGNGNFLKRINEARPEVETTGIDISAEAVEMAKSKGVNCLNCSVEEYADNSKEQYELILAFEVLEHIYNPLSLIKALRILLKKNGLIYMTMPNYLSYDFLQIGDVYRNFFGPSHLNYFNPSSIKKLLERAEYRCVKIFCDGVLDAAIVENYHSNKKKMQYGFWRYIYDNSEKHSSFLTDFQKLLQKHKLSGNMTVIARKS